MILANDHNILATPIWKEVMNWAKEDKITLITLLSRSLSESTANDNGKEKTLRMLAKHAGSWVGDENAEDVIKHIADGKHSSMQPLKF